MDTLVECTVTLARLFQAKASFTNIRITVLLTYLQVLQTEGFRKPPIFKSLRYGSWLFIYISIFGGVITRVSLRQSRRLFPPFVLERSKTRRLSTIGIFGR
ncbi:hypothetical protein F4811DRAFT_519380 [Daldinia bambusicola]|nr:hypothetical protein F4811DRAFT_519380 [Daldinia bambusicola]